MKYTELFRIRRSLDAMHIRFIELHKAVDGLREQLRTMQKVIEEFPDFNIAFNKAKVAYEQAREREAQLQKQGKKLSKRGEGGRD